jgi:hypothetical protein
MEILIDDKRISSVKTILGHPCGGGKNEIFERKMPVLP